ncbi:MAG: peptide deformylase [Calditrichaeota bacterium]|nr:MAG: peptide deformylase [Calditrichota bacterium]MBL1204245.1 peptide deformylase [Calditrichota bacterium]NOG44075.1 peptide deformylase [Calditrichota bacterium]
MLKLRLIGDPILRRETEEVQVFDQSLKDFVKQMIKKMHREDGIGLAAPQIGHSKKVLVVDISAIEEEAEPQAFINPEIVEGIGASVVEEGCLSIPEVREDVERPETIKLKYLDENGDSFENEFDGWMARVLQHEIDHLNGVLFVDLISPIKRQLLISQKMIPEKY